MIEEAALAKAVNEAKLTTLGMLVAGFAHEVNTPLGAINSNHDVLRRALAKLQVILEDEVVEPHELDEVRRIVRAVDGVLAVNDLAVERMTRLVQSLRTFGRLDHSRLDWSDLHQGIDATLAILGHEVRDVEIDRRYGTLPPVRCHPDQLNQVWMNLTQNALHAMPDGGTLTITTRADGDRVRIQFTDTGRGMSPEEISHIFEPGFTTKSNRMGMGLGLLLTRQVVDHHAGAILVESDPGAGSVFTIVLPVQGP
jgi:two-component system, NtrC family, sensor kinase